jgi:SAM-dependent methyltransferase
MGHAAGGSPRDRRGVHDSFGSGSRSRCLRSAPVAVPQDAGEPSARFLRERGAAYFRLQDQLAERSAVLNLWKFERHVHSGETVVDFGCGTGALLAKLAAGRRIGVEVNAPARARAQSRGLEVLAASSELPDAVADLVISNHALEHALQPLLELRELRRALKPGGQLVLWLPLDDWRAQKSAREDDKDNHLYGWTPLLLGNLLSEAGYEVEAVRIATTAWRHNYVAARRLLPSPAYRALTFLTAVGLRRRQMHAIARRPS